MDRRALENFKAIRKSVPAKFKVIAIVDLFLFNANFILFYLQDLLKVRSFGYVFLFCIIMEVALLITFLNINLGIDEKIYKIFAIEKIVSLILVSLIFVLVNFLISKETDFYNYDFQFFSLIMVIYILISTIILCIVLFKGEEK